MRGDTTAESLGELRPAFAKDGTITAGSASQISDGACAVVVMSKAKAEELGLEWLAEIGAHGMVAGPDSTLQLQPANATKKACEKEGIAPTDLDLVEFNEAFAAVGIDSARAARPRRVQGQRQRRRDRARPPGRHVRRPVVLHLALELKRRGGGVGAAALCGGGGQGDALIVACPEGLSSPSTTSSGRAREGDARAVARLISLVEDESPLLREVMAALGPHTGNAQVIGITGSPGVGKSTSTNALVDRAPQAGQAGRGARRRPVVAVLRWRAARRPGADAGPRPRPRASTSGRWPRAATSAAWPGRPRRRCGCSTPPAAT